MIESDFVEWERFLEVGMIFDVIAVVWNEFLYTDNLEEGEMVELHGLQQKDNTQEVNTSDHHQETEIHLDTTQRHEDNKDKETTSDYQDTASAVYVNSVNSTYDVDVVSKNHWTPYTRKHGAHRPALDHPRRLVLTSTL